MTKAYRGEPVQMNGIELWMERHGYREDHHLVKPADVGRLIEILAKRHEQESGALEQHGRCDDC